MSKVNLWKNKSTRVETGKLPTDGAKKRKVDVDEVESVKTGTELLVV